MKIRNHVEARDFTPEGALDRAALAFPELTFEIRQEATRFLNRSVVTLAVKHNSTTIYRGGVTNQGFADDDRHFERLVDAMTEELLRRAAVDLAAWRKANPLPAPAAVETERDEASFNSSSERDTTSP